MLETLDDVPWAGLTHAYGSAADVPDQLRALLSDDPKRIKQVLFTFTCNIFHQGSIYPATIPATRYLIELLQHESSMLKAGILNLLVYFATGYPEEPLTRQGVLELAKIKRDDPNAKCEEDAGCEDDEDARIRFACYAEIAAGYEQYISLLDDDTPVAIASSHLLAFLPIHAFSSGNRLLAIARNDQEDKYLRASCLMALGYMHGANVGEQAALYCDALLAQVQTFVDKISVVEAAATFYLLAVSDFRATVDQGHLKDVADHFLRHGIDLPKPPYYEQRSSANEINTSRDYYEAFLEPIIEFPWKMEVEIQREVRKRFRSAESRSLESDTTSTIDEFSIEQVFDELRQSTSSERAKALSSILLREAFGGFNGVKSCEFPERVFRTESWTELQRRALVAIASCDLLWPSISYLVHCYLDLEFDPERQELLDALAGKPQGHVDDEDEATREPDFSNAGVLAATKRLFESFAIKRRNLQNELERYQVYLPYSAAGLEFLIDQLTRGKSLIERKSAAWAIGRLGKYGAAAAPALARQITEDPENEYARYALSDLPIDDDVFEYALNTIESEVPHSYQLLRIVRAPIPVERLRHWLVNCSPDLQRLALAQLATSSFDEVREHLLRALESDDEQLASMARDSLAAPGAAPWFFANLQELSRTQRHQIAAGYNRSWIDYGDQREGFYSAIASADDVELASKLLRALHGFRKWQKSDVIRLGELCDSFDTADWKLEIIGILGKLDALDFRDEILPIVRRMLHHPCEYVRASALRTLPNCREAINSARAAWSDSSITVRREVLWKLIQSDKSAVEFFKRQLETETTDPIAMEVVWCLVAQQQLPNGFSIACPEKMPLTANLLAALA